MSAAATPRLFPVAVFSKDIQICCAPAPRDPELLLRLTRVWESAVLATHHFLTAADRSMIKAMVPQALAATAYLYPAMDRTLGPVGFMGIEGTKLEMLFLLADMRGRGLGRAMVTCAIARHAVSRVVVNEQNPAARGFYEHLGFRMTGRSPVDEQGNPWPVLFLERS